MKRIQLWPRAYLVLMLICVAASIPAFAAEEALQSVSEDAPMPWFTFTPSDPEPGELVTLDASPSKGEGGILSYQWDTTGDGRIDRAGVRVRTVFNEPGMHDVTLTVHDGLGRVAQVSRQIGVGSPGGVELSLRTDPPGFVVYIDGVRRGHTPLEITVEPGERHLRLRHYWLSDWQTSLDLRNVKSLALDLRLGDGI